MFKEVKNILVILAVLGAVIYFIYQKDRINKLEKDINYINSTINIKVEEKLLEEESYVIDSLIKVLDSVKLPKKPDTIFIIKDVIKYEKSKNSILDSVSKYQYFWSSSQLDSMYSK